MAKVSFSGTIYAKSGAVSLTGPSGVDTSLSSAVIAASVIKTASSALTLDFDSSLNAPLLSPSAPANIGLVR